MYTEGKVRQGFQEVIEKLDELIVDTEKLAKEREGEYKTDHVDGIREDSINLQKFRLEIIKMSRKY